MRAASSTVATLAPHWTLALRVLDAEHAGAESEQIKEVLGLDETSLADALALAQRLRDCYRDILSLPER